jgi:hypothetical protein
MTKKINPRAVCVSLRPEDVATLRLIADEQRSTVAAVGRALIQDGLRTLGRPVRTHVPYETLRGPRNRAA